MVELLTCGFKLGVYFLLVKGSRHMIRIITLGFQVFCSTLDFNRESVSLCVHVYRKYSSSEVFEVGFSPPWLDLLMMILYWNNR